MRQAPPVALTLSCAGAWRAAQVVLPALAAAVLTAWLAAWTAAAPSWALLVAAAVLAAAASTSKPKTVHLQWTGEHWSANGTAGDVDLMIDLGRWMLLRFRAPTGRPLWLPVSRLEAGASEQGLRAALYGRGAAPLQRQA